MPLEVTRSRVLARTPSLRLNIVTASAMARPTPTTVIAARLANESGVRLAAPMLHEPVYVLAGERGVVDANALGFVPRTTQEFVLPAFKSGGPMKALDDPIRDAGYDPAAATGELIVNGNLADILGLAVGDEVRLSLAPAEPTNAIAFRVVGVTSPDFESPQEKTVYVHLGELQLVTGKHGRDAVDFVGLKLADAREADALADRLDEAYPVEAFSNDDLVAEVGQLTSTFEGFARMIGIVTLGVALLFVATVMMLVVNERTAELGALRAIGMSQARLFRLILAEAAILVAVAAAVGLVAGYFGALGFDAYLRETQGSRTPAAFHFTKFSWPLLLQVTGLTALMGLVAGLVPAWRASRINLLVALRSV